MFSIIKNLFKKSSKTTAKKDSLIYFNVKKYYPIQERKDFFKYAVVKGSAWNPKTKAEKNFKGELLIFDCKNKAKEVAAAKNKLLYKKEYRKNNPLYLWS